MRRRILLTILTIALLIQIVKIPGYSGGRNTQFDEGDLRYKILNANNRTVEVMGLISDYKVVSSFMCNLL